MRLNFQSFEDLVQENVQALLQDEKEIEQIELRLEEKYLNESSQDYASTSKMTT
ncbi:MAG TPA: FbpB family small basic protein [Bacillota bacterium]|nr:FbpB family small basic protein [Bacillota bacterium]